MAALTALSLATTVIAGGVAAYGQYQAGQNAKAIAERNNQLAQNAATQSSWEQSENARRERANNESQLSTIRARMVGRGIQINTGAPLEIMGDAAARLELNVLDGARAAESRRAQMIAQGEMGIWEGNQAATAGKINAFGTLLSTTNSFNKMRSQSAYSGSLLGTSRPPRAIPVREY